MAGLVTVAVRGVTLGSKSPYCKIRKLNMQLRPLGPLSDNRFWQFGGAVGGAMVVPLEGHGGAVCVPFMIYFRLWHRLAGPGG
jgi:hypothetical protein